jgi:sugar lactone lactonase YvrE
MGKQLMTTAYHDLGISSQQITALMRRINALEVDGGYIVTVENTGAGDVSADFQLDGDGNLWGIQSDNVRKYNDNLEVIGSFAVPIASSQFAIDASGNFAFGSSAASGRVEITTNDGTSVYSWGTKGAADDELNIIRGIAISPTNGDLYVSDFNNISGTNHQVKRFTLSGGFVKVVAAQGSDPGEVGVPRGLSFRPDGTLLVCDSQPNRIHVFDSDDNYVESVLSSLVISDPYDVIHRSDGGVWIATVGGAGKATIFGYDSDWNLDYEIGASSFGATGIIEKGNSLYVGITHSVSPVFRSWKLSKLTQSTFFAYDPAPVSLGTPDGGVSVPALNGLSVEVIPNSKMAAQIIIDMREAIEALAPFYENAVTGDPFNWTDADADNLYSLAVDTTDYGDTGTQYDWHRTKNSMITRIPVSRDIGEIEDCVTLLEASDLVT